MTTTARWYMITAVGYVTLCTDRLDAEQTARDADAEWPGHGPHRAVQLIDASRVVSILAMLAGVDFGAAGWSTDAEAAARDARELLIEYSAK